MIYDLIFDPNWNEVQRGYSAELRNCPLVASVFGGHAYGPG